MESGPVGFFPFSAGIVIPSIILTGSNVVSENTTHQFSDSRTDSQTIKNLHCSFALYLNSNDPLAASPAITSVGAPDLLPRTSSFFHDYLVTHHNSVKTTWMLNSAATASLPAFSGFIRTLSQAVCRECETQLPCGSSKIANVIPSRQRIDLWTNREGHSGGHSFSLHLVPIAIDRNEYLIMYGYFSGGSARHIFPPYRRGNIPTLTYIIPPSNTNRSVHRFPFHAFFSCFIYILLRTIRRNCGMHILISFFLLFSCIPRKII